MGRRKNGEGSLRLRKDGRWEGRIVIGYDDKGYPITKNVTAKTKTKCLEKLEELKNQCGVIAQDRAKAEMLFGEWIDFWYQNYCKLTIKLKTQEDYELRIYKHIIPEIGKIPLNKLTQNDLQKFYTRIKTSGRLKHTEKLGEGLSNRMVRGCHTTCRAALQKAVEDGMIHINPAEGCKLPPKKTKEMQVLRREEMQRFLIQAKYDGYYEIFLMTLCTGLRRGEVMALQWNDINFKTRELHITRQVYRAKGKLRIADLKTTESERTIILPPSLVNMLKEYSQMVNSRWVFPSPVKEDIPRDPNTIYSKMQLVLERAGCKKVRFHDLRHTFATTAIENGMDVKTLSEIMGHVSSKTALNIYLHSTDEMKKQAANKIDRHFGKNINTTKETTPQEHKKQPQAKFEPTKGKIRKRGTGCISKINDHLYEGRYSPKGPDGKRISKNVYAKTREECEEKLVELIEEIKKNK